MPPLTSRLVLSTLGALLLGVVAGAVGTVLHRSTRPWGLVVGLLLVLAVAVAARAGGGRIASTALLAGVFLAVQVLSGRGPGGDVLVPAAGAIGWVWAVGALAVALGAALAPSAWFADVPLRRRPSTP